jgi:mRNA interferase RelE/StbE
MSLRVVWTSGAWRDLQRLDRKLSERVVAAVDRFADNGHGDVKRLQGSPQYRLRVGDWRVRFLLATTTQTLTVLRVLPRGSAYR